MVKRKSHTTGSVRMRTNAYGKRKVVAITTRGKSKKHTVTASSTSYQKRKGLKGDTGSYNKPRYVGRKTGRKA